MKHLVNLDVPPQELMARLIALKESTPDRSIPFMAAIRKRGGALHTTLIERPPAYPGEPAKPNPGVTSSRFYFQQAGRSHIVRIPEGKNFSDVVLSAARIFFKRDPSLCDLIMADDVNEQPQLLGGSLFVAQFDRELEPTAVMRKTYAMIDGKLGWVHPIDEQEPEFVTSLLQVGLPKKALIPQVAL